MSIYRRFEAAGFPSLVTTNTHQRRALFGAEPAATLLIEVLYGVRGETGLQLLAFVVMPDHLHAVLLPSTAHRLGQIVQLIKGRFARRYNQARCVAGPVWQGRYHERALRGEREIMTAVRYVHHNPVVAGLASEAETYAWSTAGGQYPTDLLAVLGSG